ncbi:MULTISPECIES: MerR family transcriptional regulator [Streptomyces]|jgi:DNA-binding transcriptional MerR regulator|uniref:DNA-binding transcriptional MerR regulator n=2 Tax=Streptomyces TaxID=1883 RepID=A0A514JVD8_9ACTN|nr:MULTISPECIES: MerR family transcriptional regulator [Streptomyces]MBA8942969.1 DNA-binding transcriptional MerR regulator [Streptomyces calvus]MBA8978647.1 DNA-binding transcriptional MerR regulator [Streptomyces calvus]MYS26028.1 MerR family transcriptional regulator [Streptomyces sp. SID7804]QDI71345.1 MerR family transcriptional regulator [Streptomyces calvus]GGP34334.1 MerR family transcriptional regulator [Streptomyces calvus]
MRIGELAAVVGVTTRTVRHYHQLGLLPEPERLGNGYRDYTLRHAVVLARVRRLTELGLGLAEVRDVLADDAGKDLVEVLTELDEDLARQEAAIRDRRARLRTLLESDGAPPAEGPVSAELAAVFRQMGNVTDSPMAAKDRELLALIETAAPPEERERLTALLSGALGAPGGAERALALYRLLDSLAEVGPDDPRVEEAARALAACVPADLVPEGSDVTADDAFVRAFYADFAPAQAEAIRRALRIVAEERS